MKRFEDLKHYKYDRFFSGIKKSVVLPWRRCAVTIISSWIDYSKIFTKRTIPKNNNKQYFY